MRAQATAGGHLDLPMDDNGRIVGFMVGKTAAVADWMARTEQRGYDKLFRRLYARNWARKDRAADPERARARLRRWRAAHVERVREAGREARRARVRAAAPSNIRTCDQCGARWCLVPLVGRKARFCGRACANQWHGSRRNRSRGLRNMDIRPQVLATLDVHGPLRLAELAALLPHVKRGSMATLLTVMVQTGQLRTDGAKVRRRYSR